TKSIGVGIAAGAAVLVVRLLEDYLLLPRVLGGATGLSPLLVLVSVTASAVLFGGFAVLLAVPFAALVATLVEVTVLDRAAREAEVPTVLFPAKDAERRFEPGSAPAQVVGRAADPLDLLLRLLDLADCGGLIRADVVLDLRQLTLDLAQLLAFAVAAKGEVAERERREDPERPADDDEYLDPVHHDRP